MELILLATDAVGLVQAIPDDDFVLTVKDIGDTDAIPLLEMSSDDQLTYLFDLEMDAFAVIYPSGQVLLQEELAKVDWKLVSASTSTSTAATNVSSSLDDETILLPNERILGGTTSSNSSDDIIIGNYC